LTGLRLKALVVFFAGVACSCAGSRPAGAERLAVQAIENLTSDPSIDWIGPALSDVLAEELTGVSSLHPQKVGSRSEALAFRATHLVSGYFTLRNGQLDVRLQVEDLESHQLAGSLRAQAPPEDVIPLADLLASRISPERRAYGTSDIDAIRLYALAIGPGRPADYDCLLWQALDTDPGFSQAYVALGQFHLLRGDRDVAVSVVEEALSGEDDIDDINRTRLELIRALSLDDPEAEVAATQKLAALIPADSALAEQAGLSLLNSREYAAASSWLAEAAQTEPSNRQYWNMLGYAEAWDRNLDAARASLARYREVAPNDPNALDSLGEIHFHLGEFAEAARYFLECIRMDPGFQNGIASWKAAQATWRAGDLDRADQLVDQYAADLGSSQLSSFQQARWLYLTGRTRQAMEQLQEFASRDTAAPRAAMSAYALLTVWAAEEPEGTDRAAWFASQAQRLEESGGSFAWSPVVSLLSESGESPEKLEQRIASAFPDPDQDALRTTTYGQLLFFHHHYAEAIPVLRSLMDSAAPFTEDEFGWQLGYSLAETGEQEEAERLLSVWPVVQPGQESLFYEITVRRALSRNEER